MSFPWLGLVERRIFEAQVDLLLLLLKRGNLAGQFGEFARFLVAQLTVAVGLGFRRTVLRFGDRGKLFGRRGARRVGTTPGLLVGPVLVAAGVFVPAAVAFIRDRLRHHVVEEGAVVADEE